MEHVEAELQWFCTTACRRKGPATGHLFLVADGLTPVYIHIDPRLPHFAEAGETSGKEVDWPIGCQADMDLSIDLCNVDFGEIFSELPGP